MLRLTIANLFSMKPPDVDIEHGFRPAQVQQSEIGA
jgi:hypothetical protein